MQDRISEPRWLSAYLIGNTLFVKRLLLAIDQPYPIFGCNARCIAVISSSKLRVSAHCHVASGASAVHVETWELHTGVSGTETPAGLAISAARSELIE